jgi:O-acetyl-ADP-ribose deacetylase (regulator of RNase III)
MIKYVSGDATEPRGDGKKSILHIVNNLGAWGAGFVLAISNKWRKPELEYRRAGIQLGAIQVVDVEPDVSIINMCAQDGLPSRTRRRAVDYEALAKCLDTARSVVLFPRGSQGTKGSVHMPRIGCGIAGGEWSEVEPLIIENLVHHGIDVTVYDFEEAVKWDKRRIPSGRFSFQEPSEVNMPLVAFRP